MTELGLYTATENELGALGRAAGEVDAAVSARSESDLDDPTDAAAWVEELTDATASASFTPPSSRSSAR